MPVLEVLTGDLEGRSYPLDERVFSIGRNSDNNLVLPKRFISRRHAEIMVKNGRYVVRGLSRKNPIFHNNNETFELALADGEVFEICDVRFRFRERVSASGRQAATSPRSQEKHRFGEADSLTGDAVGGAVPSDDDFDDADFGGKLEEEEDDTAALGAAMSKVRAKHAASMPSASVEAGRERIVFGAEEEGDFEDDEKTGMVKLEDSAEQTGAIDLLNVDAPLDDPFSDKNAQTADQEKMFRVLTAVGVCAIAVAGIMVMLINKPLPPEHREAQPIAINRGQVLVSESDFASEDQPVAMLDSDGTFRPLKRATGAILVVDNAIARIEWILPQLDRRAIFLVRGGDEQGAVKFTLRYAKKADTKTFTFKVEGEGAKAREREARLAKLIALSPDQIKGNIRQRLAEGRELWKERNAAGFEANFARTLEKYRLAEEGVDAMKAKLKQYDPEYLDLVNEVKKSIETAEEEYKTFFKKQCAVFNRAQETGARAQQEAELKKLLKIIYDKSSYDYQRYKLFLDNYYSNR